MASDLRNLLSNIDLTARSSQEHHENVSLELPSPPEGSPISNEGQESASQSSLRSNSYLRNRTSLALSLHSDTGKEEFIWPFEEEFSLNYHCEFDDIIGEGLFGTCYRATVRRVDTGKERIVCIKRTKSGYFANELKVLQLARKENVPQIVSFFGAITNRRDAFMCMELLEGGTIGNLIEERKGEPLPIIPEIDILHYVVDALAALKFIHEKGIVHGDIHDKNFVLDKFLVKVKLIDFGAAKSIEKGGNVNADIWNISYLILKMWNGEKFQEGALGIENLKEFIPSEAKGSTKKLLQRILQVKEDIPSAAELLRVFQGDYKEKVVHFFKFSGADIFPSDGEVSCVSPPSNQQAMLSSTKLAGQTVLSMFPLWGEGGHNLVLFHCVRRGWLNHGCRGYESLSTRAKGSTCCLHRRLSGRQPRCGWRGGKSVH